jgi:hypothetical protein
MNGHKLFLDTNIILYLLGGDRTLASFLNQKVITIFYTNHKPLP